MRHLHRAAVVAQRDLQGVVADHSHRGELCRGRQRTITGGGQQQISIHLVFALERGALARPGKRPELAAFLQHTGGFQLKAAVLGEVAVELQHFLRLHDLEALGHDRERALGVGAVEHLLLGEGMDRSDRLAAGDVADFRLLDRPVHARLALPGVNRLKGGELVAKAMPWLLAGIGHRFDQVHVESSCWRHKRRRPAGQGGPSVSASGWLGKAIKRRLLEQRGHHRGCHEKNAVDRLFGVVAHRLDPNKR